jgi:triacylglycerol lipase
MARLAQALRASGKCVHSIDLVPNDGSAPIEELSHQLEAFVTNHLPEGACFDIAAYSMGGIVARHYLQERNGHLRVRRFVSISSPHHGTLAAYLRNKPGARQMRIGSPFLKHLARPESMAKLPPTMSFLTVTDLIIIPFTSSSLTGAHNIRLFGWGHFTGIIETHAIRQIVAALDYPSH